MSLNFLRRGLLLACCLTLMACGFHLRAPQILPFNSIYLGNSTLAPQLRHKIELTGHTVVTDHPEDAEVRMQIVRDGTTEEIATISGSGVVNQYDLKQRFAFRLVDKKGHEIMPFTEIYVYRSLDFQTGHELSKEQEEIVLYADMKKDIVQQVMRRLAAVKMN